MLHFNMVNNKSKFSSYLFQGQAFVLNLQYTKQLLHHKNIQHLNFYSNNNSSGFTNRIQHSKLLMVTLSFGILKISLGSPH
jgi:hypothetical protein